MTPTERARYRIALAAALGEGRRVTREQILAELGDTDAPVTPGRVTPTAVQSAPPVPVLAVAFLAPDIVTPDATPDDDIVSIESAALTLQVTPATVRRYLAPSAHPRRRLVRLGDGVSRASVLALSASRAA